MPRGRGGRRQGTPGTAYTNRTDLATDYSPPSPAATPASGGAPPPMPMPAGPTPDQVPRLDDPTAKPDEPVMTPGVPMASDQIIDDLYRAYQLYPTDALRRSITMYHTRYGRNRG